MRNLFLPAVMILFFACKKQSFTNSADALLSVTADSVHFDTVFTSMGSASRVLKIINNNKKGIHISTVRLAGGTSSPFRINVDGITGPQVNDLDLAANDSMYVFITVSINPDANNLPFIVRDSIEIGYNGNIKMVQLDAYGRNAHFFRNRLITTAETWYDDLPYVILGRLTVDTNALLTINKGCKIFLHADAPFIVNGSLIVNGEKEDSSRVVFAADRLDDPYRNFPAGYPGLIFNDVSRNNTINYAIIKNAYQGISVLEPTQGIKLTINETIIDNAYDAALVGINTSIDARNLLVSNCGKTILLLGGGSYHFTHCTAAAYSNSFVEHRYPILTVTNYLSPSSTNDLDAVFRNCIFWAENSGLVNDEVVVSKQGSTAFNVRFENVLWRVETNPSNSNIIDAINNQDPLFDSINTSQRFYSFRLKEGSPAIDKGQMTNVTVDLDGSPRPVGIPDLGAYERQ